MVDLTYEIACIKCGNTLYSGFELRSPDDILKVFGYKCKKCGVKLTSQKFRIEIKRIEGSFA